MPVNPIASAVAVITARQKNATSLSINLGCLFNLNLREACHTRSSAEWWSTSSHTSISYSIPRFNVMSCLSWQRTVLLLIAETEMRSDRWWLHWDELLLMCSKNREKKISDYLNNSIQNLLLQLFSNHTLNDCLALFFILFSPWVFFFFFIIVLSHLPFKKLLILWHKGHLAVAENKAREQHVWRHVTVLSEL